MLEEKFRREQMSIDDLKNDWNDLAELDPYWAILSIPEKQFGKWNVEEFFSTGNQEIEQVLIKSKKLGYPLQYEKALDFGCGVGRLTRALAKKIDQCYGVDVSEKMIEKAKELNRNISNCKFFVNEHDDLRIFQDRDFDLIYTNIVLQHMPSKSMIKSYISEFVRILRFDGLLVFQVPSQILNVEIGLRGASKFGELRKQGHSPKFLYEEKNLNPIGMNCVPENEVVSLLNEKGAKILEIVHDSMAGSEVQSRTYYVTKLSKST